MSAVCVMSHNGPKRKSHREQVKLLKSNKENSTSQCVEAFEAKTAGKGCIKRKQSKSALSQFQELEGQTAAPKRSEDESGCEDVRENRKKSNKKKHHFRFKEDKKHRDDGFSDKEVDRQLFQIYQNVSSITRDMTNDTSDAMQSFRCSLVNIKHTMCLNEGNANERREQFQSLVDDSITVLLVQVQMIDPEEARLQSIWDEEQRQSDALSYEQSRTADARI